ncbi:MAG: winged helix DNA-binding protein [Bacteroidales bacterium]|nr:winged helix DNA-binding protein [Bacteroidales bacterium]MDD2263694.1 winged helix DNA-binding protein [Bacteroidales bacterium]MDD2831088.1 winged helix DNA-binding protein [Bacteroidales bacterium]MDD3208104.1 winged helix DNA-binding protein [Bacteroidales bacterium]MDD3696854.1 winged helix DNA-binding protein [Bacteroidales bacterium]
MNDSICLMKDVLKAFNEFEKSLLKVHSLSLNEAMLLCMLGEYGKGKGHLSASEIAEITGFTASHTSKVLRSAESRNWISRSLCDQDRRKMHFELTPAGLNKLKQLKGTPVEVPELLKKLL